MSKYDEVKSLIIKTLMGRPNGSEIQPNEHQDYAINMLDYIKEVETSSIGSLSGYATANTIPIQFRRAKIYYLSGIDKNSTITYNYFMDSNGLPITITSGNSGLLIILFWNLNYWEFHTYKTSVDSYPSNYGYNIKKTYSSVAEMQADTVLIGDSGLPINIGDIVSVVNTTTPTENGLYSRIDSGWQFQTSANLTIEQVRSQNTTTAPSSKLLDDELEKKVDKVTGSRLLTNSEADSIAAAVTRTTFEEELSKKVDSVSGAGLITDSERTSIANAIDSTTLSAELVKKVDKVSGERLITLPEIQKLQGAATVSEITAETDKCVKIDTSEIELVSEDYTNVVLYSRDETQNKLLKIDVPTFISDIKAEADVVYPTYRSLVGTQNGSNSQFKYQGTLIQETAELYIGGMLYPVNIGFTFEGDTIVITGAPIPTAEDIMRLKAIYLT